MVSDFSVPNTTPLDVFAVHVGCVIFGDCEQAVVTCRSCVFVNPTDFTAAAQFGVANEIVTLNAYPGKARTCFGGVHTSRDVVAPLTFRRTIGCTSVILNGRRYEGFYMADIDTRHASYQYTHLPLYEERKPEPLWNAGNVLTHRTYELAAVNLVFKLYVESLLVPPVTNRPSLCRRKLQHLIVFRSLCRSTWYNQALLWQQERLMRMLRPVAGEFNATLYPAGNQVRTFFIGMRPSMTCNGHDYLLPATVAEFVHDLLYKVKNHQARILQGVVMEARPCSVYAGQTVGDAMFTPNEDDFVVRKLFTYIRTIVRMWEHAGYGYDGQRFVLSELVESSFHLSDAERKEHQGRARVLHRLGKLLAGLRRMSRALPTFSRSFLTHY